MPFDINQVLQIVESGNWFSCRFITADQTKQSGGEAIELKKCRLVERRRDLKNTTDSSATVPATNGIRKNPLHNYHFTRNLELENGRMRKVHPLLIFQINGEKVI